MTQLSRILATLALTGCAIDGPDLATLSTEVVTTHALPGRIEAEDYATGGEGTGYHDTTGVNSGGAYRSDGVDIEATSDAGGGYDVGWAQPGEWLAYTFTAERSGSYAFAARVASGLTGPKSFRLVVDGTALPAASFTATGNWQTWITVPAGAIQLAAGAHTLRFEQQSQGMNVNYIDAAVTGTMLVGAAASPHNDRTTSDDELAFLESKVGRLDLHRVYDSGFDTNFLHKAGIDVGKRATHYSFKPDMAALAAGSLDANVRALLQSIPAGHRTILTIWHEPEDNFTTAAQQATYRAGWVRFAQLVRAANRPELSTSWVMMSWSWNTGAGRDPNSWWPGDGVVDSVGLDGYNDGSLKGTRWDSPGRPYGMAAPGDSKGGTYVDGGAIAWIKAKHVAWGIAEFGTLENDNNVAAGWTATPTKAAWLEAAAAFFYAQGASYIEYFHAGPYRGPWWLDSSQAALDAYRDVIARY